MITLFCVTAAVGFESVASPPGEGAGAGIAALLTLTIDPTATFNGSEYVEVSVHVAVMTGGGETAIGEEQYYNNS